MPGIRKSMKNQAVLFVCNSPFQIITALCIRMHFFSKTLADIIVTDQMQGYKEIAQKTRRTGVFRNVVCASNYDYISYHGKGNKKPVTIPEKIRDAFSAQSRVKRMLSCDVAAYSDIFIFNWDRFTVILYEYLWKRNHALSVHLFEEGITSYEHILLPYECTFSYAESLGKIKKSVRRLLGKPDLYRNIRDAYVFRPEMLGKSFPLPTHRIPLLSDDCKGINQVLFDIFDCENVEDYLNADVIFFEESYAREGIPIDYGTIIKSVLEVVSKNRILIKRHPRSRDDVFERMGLRVNTLQHVPWEIIVLRHPELCDKIWISICCSSMICPYYYLDMKTNSVFLFEMTRFQPNEKTAVYIDNVRKKLLDPYPEVFIIPRDKEQLSQIMTAKKDSIKEDNNNA